MKAFTYWETLPGKRVPPYVALGIVSMKIAYGENFVLLNEENVSEYISGCEEKKWAFSKYNSNLTPEMAAVVAKSDYVRMRFVAEHGGFWNDADTVVLTDMLRRIEIQGDELHWHSEAVFAARRGNPILSDVAENMLVSEFQTWGNPGGIKDVLKGGKVVPIPFKYVDPGVVPVYSFRNSEIILDEEISVSDFLVNRDVCLLKLYNTDFGARKVGQMSVADFLDSGLMLSRIFLSINSDKRFWASEVGKIFSNVA
ncbi:capsular polysaccharide synthesis protein [Cupriavidus sp. SS-3]|uniref:capsular polysaccharide synthesis protein n=1 Tax=Cupriavidus sp. SS-3 TaxID=3109596 RepID=UPI002DBAABFE|nr:capsular polysaccharide synthesis protein [Cupriavidus sp. SS-3]MEC3766366.1 capsular polysaccharide synthesis protein [Cupriavidus sp. SS-3]